MSRTPNPFPLAPQAVVDTSFWSLAGLSGLEPYLWKQWRLIAAPAIVQQELFHVPKATPQQQRFQEAVNAGHLIIQNPLTWIPTLSKGERAVVSLAIEAKIPALVDDYRAHRHAVNTYSVRALSVSQCLVGFLYRGILTLDDAEQTFQQLKQLGATNAIFLQQAAQAIYAKGGSMLWP